MYTLICKYIYSNDIEWHAVRIIRPILLFVKCKFAEVLSTIDLFWRSS